MTTAASHDLEVFDKFPEVLIDHDNVAFYRGLLAHQVVLNRCGECGHWHSEPLRPTCPACWSWDIRHQAVSGRGVIHSYTRLHQGPPIDGLKYDPPVTLALVDLEEQPHLRVVGGIVNQVDPAALIGSRVEVVWSTGSVAPRIMFRLIEERS